MHSRLLALVSGSILACAPPTPTQVLAPSCAGPVTDTTGWTRESFAGGSILIPPGLHRDESDIATLTYYHGGGSWVGERESIVFSFVSPDGFPGFPPSFDTLPGVPACWPAPPGWMVRYDTGVRNGEPYARTWFRRPASSRHWLIFFATSPDSALIPALLTSVMSGRPDSALWSQVR